MTETVLMPLPEPKTKTKPRARKAKKPVFQEPTLPEGSIGGFVIDRTPVESGSWQNRDLALAFWSPRFGRITPWFEVTLSSKQGQHKVLMPESCLYDFTYGDWITVDEYRTVDSSLLATRADFIKVPRETIDIALDLHWIGPAASIDGEGKIHTAFDEQGRRIYIRHGSLRRHFGKVKSTHKQIAVEPYVDQSGVDDDPFAILGVSFEASDDEVKAAFRQKSKETHPDLNPDDESAADKFHAVKEAYELIKDEARRQLYMMALTMSMATFGQFGNRIDFMTGKHGDLWYPPINSGKIKAKGYFFGNAVLLEKVLDLSPVTMGNRQRVAAFTNGVIRLAWKI